ncbi:receptor-type tyrosine-protein phosphatase beta-like [Mytilus californianus]|uniref:receptor-type tyrosine-protein phosphatase beta-like n=1 Tax=Mytilus californianus TaxID=6549 RepID=UPI00224807BF|nr:receptor-type tyrosine-protein phosphatase beta-like [Mytilus californianus]
MHGYSCECVPGYTGENCSTNINECQSDPCQNGGKCAHAINGYSCQCVPGYTGKNCSTNINECQSDPCQNGGKCTDAINGYSCQCVPGYAGKNCSTNINECQSDPCQNGGKCTDAINGYSCQCVPGYTGKNCSTNINECQSDPCQNGGKCTDSINVYSCQCVPGYTGKDCSTNIDECQPDPCQNEGKCTDAIHGYSCECVQGYTGKNCSTNNYMDIKKLFNLQDLGLLSPKHEMYESQIQENRPKNRYTNILPFDHSIVKLIEIEDEPGSDFINANYIPGYSSPREYIASQGPLPATQADFWRMVWEQNVSIIVMLTQLMERGRKKCELYWPEDTKEKRFFGDIIVEVESDSFLPEYALRIIVLRMGDVERRIRHYNYLAWPDMGTPKTSNNMITFVDTIRREVKPTTNGPILVHCSAGVGRTGTFIVMDILLQELRSGRQEVDIFGTILKLRNNRVNMVQTEDQYVFIFNCIKDFIESSADSPADSELWHQKGATTADMN